MKLTTISELRKVTNSDFILFSYAENFINTKLINELFNVNIPTDYSKIWPYKSGLIWKANYE